MLKIEEYVQTSITFDTSGNYVVSCNEIDIKNKFKVSNDLAKKLLKDLNILMDLLNSSVGYKTLYFEVYDNDKCNLMKNESYMQPISPSLMQYLNYKCNINLTTSNVFNAYNIIIHNLLLNKLIKENYN